ncbi:hypothetical protein, partial [Thiobacillus sp. 63-78]|uniref:hypothetical protein n=1 Tax=Thiobacillus sp. 63-78 TaxID=1895859 RepID=UPI0025F8DCAA
DLRDQAEAAAILFEIGRIQRPVQPALSFHGYVCSGNSGLPTGQAAKLKRKVRHFNPSSRVRQ